MSFIPSYAELLAMSRPGSSYLAMQASWPLAAVVAEICERAGLPADRIDVRGLEGAVDGFSMDNSYPAFTGIETLARIFMFDASGHDGELHFIARGGAVVAELTRDDLIDDGQEIRELERKDSISVPRVLHLQYHDIDGGLAPDKQTSDRSLDARSRSEVKSETTVLLRPNDAARAVVIQHKVSIEEQRGEYNFALPDSWIWLTVGDIIMLDGERLRITEIDIDDGFQTYKCAFDRASAYVSTIQGVPPGYPSDPPSLVVADTRLEVIDSHILRDADDRLGYYVAAAPESDHYWPGALVEYSADGGATYSDSGQISSESVIGDTLTVLPSAAREYPDYVNTVRVQLVRDGMELESTDLAGMMNRVNLAIIGDELINFEQADEVEPGVWDLSGFLRGRKGSPIAEHPEGTRFVLLERSNLAFVDADMTSLNTDLTFRVTTLGGTTSEIETEHFEGRSQQSRQPSYLTATRDGSDLVIDWQGVARLGGGVNVAMGAYFVGFVVTVNGVTYNTTNSELTVPDPGGSVTITVAQRNQLTGLGPAETITI